MRDLARSGLSAVSKRIFQGLPVKFVFGHFLERIAGENELPASGVSEARAAAAMPPSPCRVLVASYD
jgi:hypothetical protein